MQYLPNQEKHYNSTVQMAALSEKKMYQLATLALLSKNQPVLPPALATQDGPCSPGFRKLMVLVDWKGVV
jgi:hypothetical protein